MSITTPLGRFDTASVERGFEPLERLERGLWLSALSNSHGSLFDRLAWLDQAVPCLDDGHNPLASATAADGWPGGAVANAFGSVIDRLGLARAVAGHPEWVMHLLRSLLWHLDSLARLSEQRGDAAALRILADSFSEQWVSERADLDQVRSIFSSLDGVISMARWSEVRGMLRGEGWRAVLAAHAALRDAPELAALIRRLGRSRETADDEQRPRPLPRFLASERLDAMRAQPVVSSGESGEPDGVHRAAALERVLASELVQWRRRSQNQQGTRRLQRVFAARLSEHALLARSLRMEEQHPVRVPLTPVPDATRQAIERRLEAGPVIVCLDTSSSMAGAAEQVAKAVVLEAMRSARAARRRCVVYAFSGPGEVNRTVLDSNVDGLIALARLLAASFHGGTDIAEPIEAALNDLREADWSQADILIVSDGEFGVTAPVLESVLRAREAGRLRVQGILIGDRETIGLREVCDRIFWVSDWRRFGGEPVVGRSPVHDSALTRLFFPAASMRAPPTR